jgi:hypothetical protein
VNRAAKIKEQIAKQFPQGLPEKSATGASTRR